MFDLVSIGDIKLDTFVVLDEEKDIVGAMRKAMRNGR